MCNSDSLRLDEFLRQNQKLSWEYVTTEETLPVPSGSTTHRSSASSAADSLELAVVPKSWNNS